MKKYRSRTEIIALILEAANQRDGVLKIKIMYSASITSKQLYDYLPFLMKNDLLEYGGQRGRTYRITRRGIHFLQVYNQLREMVGTKRLENLNIL
ncbi:MAG TPA: winged helix-turn-helix domain-containing protein [Candidatus Bathyarchaeia archaeon]|nr:winged helix-turn-helix domain-containing protein [Candidatus Bathyarchaeia archaeon]